jgi:hypothetical protein
MKKNLLLMVAAFALLADVSSQPGNFRVVEAGTENVVSSINTEPGVLISLCVQGRKANTGADRWESAYGSWDVPGPLKYPIAQYGQCMVFGYDIAINDTIRITFSDSEFIAIPLLVRYSDSTITAYVELLTNPKDAKYGDTLLFRIVTRRKDDVTLDAFCTDSIIYTMFCAKGEDTLSELLVKGENRKTGQMISQCFNNGQDTIKIILKDSTTSGLNYLAVQLGNHTGISEKFLVATSSSVTGKNKIFIHDRLAIFRNGIIQFKAEIATPVTIKVLTMKGEVVHAGVYTSAQSFTQQYSLPTSLPNGCYLLSLNVNGERSIFPCVMMK